MHCIRPDIAFVICKLSRYTSYQDIQANWIQIIGRLLQESLLPKKNNRFMLVLFWFSSCDGRI
jgi:hypothetical protein